MRQRYIGNYRTARLRDHAWPMPCVVGVDDRRRRSRRSTGRYCAAMTRSERLAEQLDWHWRENLRPRLDGLTDEEYFWEPVRDCWSIRPRGRSTAPGRRARANGRWTPRPRPGNGADPGTGDHHRLAAGTHHRLVPGLSGRMVLRRPGRRLPDFRLRRDRGRGVEAARRDVREMERGSPRALGHRPGPSAHGGP